MAVATYEDVAVALGRPISTASEQAQVEWWLSGVELFIVARLGLVSNLDQTVVQYVEVEAVAAKVNRSGRAESSITVAVDDGSVTRRYEGAVTATDITDEWWDLLEPGSNSASASIRPGFDVDFVHWSTSKPPYSDPVWQSLS